MATTTNYGFEIPDDTDLVKDGALAMRDLGQDVDTQLFTALGGNYPGLRLVKKQTIGTGVSSVTVTDAFSATYENYKIIISGGVSSTNTECRVTIGGFTANYYNCGIFGAYNGSGGAQLTVINNGAYWNQVGYVNTTGLFCDVSIYSPFLTKNTQMTCTAQQSNTGGVSLFNSGYLNNTSSCTSFTFINPTGTLTGGTIYVYGYGAS
jgi:hypothetical protein